MKKGFTLLELLTVIVIVGVLASMVSPQFTKAIDRSREVEPVAILSAVLMAQLIYYQETGRFTTHNSDLIVGIPVMQDWAVPGVSPDHAWTLLPGSPSAAQIVATSSHGHSSASDHEIRATVDAAGNRTLERKRLGESVFSPL